MNQLTIPQLLQQIVDELKIMNAKFETDANNKETKEDHPTPKARTYGHKGTKKESI